MAEIKPQEFTLVESGPTIKQTLQLSILFLEKFEYLTENERSVLIRILRNLANPLIKIDGD